MRLGRAFLLFGLVGCSSSYAGLFDDEGAPKQIVGQRVLVAEARGQGGALDERAVKLEGELPVSPEDERDGNQPLLELHSQIETLKLDLNRLQGQIEVLVNENQLTQKRQKDFYIDLDDRLRRIEQRGEAALSERAVPDSPGSESPGSESPGPESLRPEESDAKPGAGASSAMIAPAAVISTPAPADTAENAGRQAYEIAYDLFRAAKYEEAISRFNEFLETYPESGFAPSAQYWIGNSYYALRDFPNAISAQEKLITAYPDSAKVSDAMLNIASSQQEANQKTAARKTLESVISTYPRSEAAEKAKRRLANLK
ncbi:MAG: tol-pal system protein YbgF [Nitrosospira sp.]|nr:tol-pal system protein YbgF [Nitrosospira sp.]